MNVSLDLFIGASGDDERGSGGWMRIDEQVHGEINRRAHALSMMVQGRVMYDIMANSWPSVIAQVDQPDVIREYGALWTAKPKVLVSGTRTNAGHNTTICHSDGALGALAELRRSSDGDISVGGATLATSLLEAGLVDELLLFTHPVVLGSGRPLFDNLPRRPSLELAEQRRFDNGVTLHRYSVTGTAASHEAERRANVDDLAG
jgi:dihydrofolate reductase